MKSLNKDIKYNYYSIECENIRNLITDSGKTVITSNYQGKINEPNLFYSDNNSFDIGYQATHLFIYSKLHDFDKHHPDGELVILHRSTTLSTKLYCCFPLVYDKKSPTTSIDDIILSEKQTISLELNDHIPNKPNFHKMETIDKFGEQCIVILFENAIHINSKLYDLNLDNDLFINNNSRHLEHVMNYPDSVIFENTLRSSSAIIERFDIKSPSIIEGLNIQNNFKRFKNGTINTNRRFMDTFEPNKNDTLNQYQVNQQKTFRDNLIAGGAKGVTRLSDVDNLQNIFQNAVIAGAAKGVTRLPVAATPVAATPVAATSVAATSVAATPVATTPDISKVSSIMLSDLSTKINKFKGNLSKYFHPNTNKINGVQKHMNTGVVDDDETIYKCEYLPVDSEDMIQVLQMPIGSPGHNTLVNDQISNVFINNAIFMFTVAFIFITSSLLHSMLKNNINKNLLIEYTTGLFKGFNLLNLLLTALVIILTIVLLIYGIYNGNSSAISIGIFLPFFGLISYLGISYFRSLKYKDASNIGIPKKD
jgi:hypothetical protein